MSTPKGIATCLRRHHEIYLKSRKIFIRVVGRFSELTNDYLILESLIYEDDGNNNLIKDYENVYRHILRSAIVNTPTLFLEEGDDLVEYKSLIEKLNGKTIQGAENK